MTSHQRWATLALLVALSLHCPRAIAQQWSRGVVAQHAVCAVAADPIMRLTTHARNDGQQQYRFWMMVPWAAWDVDDSGLVVLDGPVVREEIFQVHTLVVAPRDMWSSVLVRPGFVPSVQFMFSLTKLRVDEPVWPLYGPAEQARPDGSWREYVHGAERWSNFDIGTEGPGLVLLHVQGAGTLSMHQIDRQGTTPSWPSRPPGRWTQRDTMAWSNTQPFRVLPTAQHWYFLTADGKLWHTPRQGEANREIKEVWAAGDKKILGTIIDHDLNRSFVFGDGWYLDLGDELRTVTEPADKPWPRPAADAPEIERLRVWRGWVDLMNPAPPAR